MRSRLPVKSIAHWFRLQVATTAMVELEAMVPEASGAKNWRVDPGSRLEVKADAQKNTPRETSAAKIKYLFVPGNKYLRRENAKLRLAQVCGPKDTCIRCAPEVEPVQGGPGTRG